MQFRSTHPDPAEFPWFGLVWPSLFPLAIVSTFWLAQAAGYVWNLHGSGVLLALALAVSTVAALVQSFVAVCAAVPALRAHPTLRSRRNLLCTAFAAVAVVVCMAVIAIAVLGMISSW